MKYYVVEYWYASENKILSGEMNLSSVTLTGAFQKAIKDIEKKGIAREALTRINIVEAQS